MIFSGESIELCVCDDFWRVERKMGSCRHLSSLRVVLFGLDIPPPCFRFGVLVLPLFIAAQQTPTPSNRTTTPWTTYLNLRTKSNISCLDDLLTILKLWARCRWKISFLRHHLDTLLTSTTYVPTQLGWRGSGSWHWHHYFCCLLLLLLVLFLV